MNKKMIFIIIAIVSAVIFPCAMIKAITSEEERKFFTVVSCITSGVVISVFFWILKYIIDNYIV